MPIYEYECKNCQKVIEKMQKFSDPPLEKCPDCNAPVTKLMSLSSFALKGSGWYTTDYKKSGKKKSDEKKSTSSDSVSESKTSPASETKTETKTESKSETKKEVKKDSGKVSKD